MALSNEEKQIIEYAKANGKSALETKAAIIKFRTGQTPTPTDTVKKPAGKPLLNKVTDFLGFKGATETFGSLLARQGLGTDTKKEVAQKFIEKPTAGQVAGAVLQTAAVPASFALTGGSSLLGQASIGAGLGYAYDVGQDLIEKKSAGDVLTPGLGTALGGVAPVLARGAIAGVGALKKPVAEAVEAGTNVASKAIPNSTTAQGVTQTASDIAERVPRYIGRVNESIKEQAIKSQRIKTSTPVVAQAIKAELPESFIQTIPKATPENKAAFKQVLDIAEKPKTTLGGKANPSIVAGDFASKQYDVIEKQRKTIGSAIGEAIKNLSKDQTVDMRPAYSQLDNLLQEQGVVPVYSEKGVTLDFSKSNLAPKQRTVLSDLYKLATEAGDTLSPYEVHKKDQLFSAIQREARSDQVADIIIELPDGKKTDIFRAFRDVYSNELDTLSPEIKALNAKYRNVATLLDDIENSIFKTPDFEITKSTDPAEFAKVNLRRIFGESQSSPVYEAIADEMDAISRQLGYTDASPKEVAAFAQEIRALYPETIPKTGFQGGMGLFDIAAKAIGAGKVDVRDQQKALRALLEASE